MRNLVVCCDGTWNTPDQEQDGVATPTNVCRLYNAIVNSTCGGAEQLVYYHPGVGADGNWWEKLAGGGFGLGLTKNIMSGYKWLAERYQPGDRIFLFGFSRGAYTVRSLGGMITGRGLLDLGPATVAPDEVWPLVEKAADAYRKRKDRSQWARGLAFHGTGTPKQVPVHFLGVWDTVGALGIPNDLALLNLIDELFDLHFHDTNLSERVHHARHALALDEERLPFSPTLWTGKGARRPTVKQVWFAGAHCDVGGGYREVGLSNLALRWMVEEARELGLAVHEGMVAQIVGDPRDVVHRSFRGAMKGLKSRPRSIPDLSRTSASIHPSVKDRQVDPPIVQGPYRVTRRLDVGESCTVDVFAAEPWNRTGIYLRRGETYRFTATGEWLDWHDRSSPDGLDDGKFQLGDLARKFGSALGLMETAWKAATGNDEADLKLTRREEGMPWFCLVGAIGNGRVTPRGKVTPHHAFRIGSGPVVEDVAKGGYLYAYANDAWHMYGNNKGGVRLTLTRTA